MLLVGDPSPSVLKDVIDGLLSGRHTRESVSSWYKAVFASYGWDISVSEADGYWYFYSLAFLSLPFPGGYFIRQADLEDWLLDLKKVPGKVLTADIRHLRTFEIDRTAVRWPIAMIVDHADLMADLPGSRGTFEKRQDMVEHCHLSCGDSDYLFVKQFDEQTGQILLLGSNRDRQQAKLLLAGLGISDYMFP